MPRWARYALLILWIGFIWAHSLVPADASTEESDFFAQFIAPLLGRLGIHEWDTVTFLVRKTAHFLEYLVLGLLTWGAVSSEPAPALPAALLAALIIVGVPAVDETIQLFVAGRSGQVSDILLDVCGGTIGYAGRVALSRLKS